VKFRKRPVIIDAVRFTPPNTETPDWLTEAFGEGSVRAMLYGTRDEPIQVLEVYTDEGTMIARVGDWIIRGVKGELYPCKPDIFERCYREITPSEAMTIRKAQST
jgi:hypothetical protein